MHTIPPYRDPELPAEVRVADLLARMTPEEKRAQLGSAWTYQLAPAGHLDPVLARERLSVGIGQITRISGASQLDATHAARLANDIQAFLRDHTRLGIPAIVHEEVCSGLMAAQATVFPQAIGVASTFDPALNEELAAAVRIEMRSRGAHQGLSPVLDVCRDPRWGRTEETYGEDPTVVGAFGTAFVRGLQGPRPTDGVLATAKHLVGYGASEGALNWAPAHLPPRELHEVYLAPFEAAVHTGLASVMPAYHELDGMPCTANDTLLREVLRERWGFTGTIVSDYGAIAQLRTVHALATDDRAAALTALRAGVDVELPTTDAYGAALAAALAGDVRPRAERSPTTPTPRAEQLLDEAVARILAHKLALGLFEDPFVDPDEAARAAVTPASLALATRLATASLVLLRNEGVLPLSGSGTVAVIGPNADDARALLGDYTHAAHLETLIEARAGAGGALGMDAPVPDDLDIEAGGTPGPSVLDALRRRLGDRVRHAPGCGVLDPDRNGIDAAVALARDAEVVVLVVGDRSGLVDGCTSGEARDRSSLDLPGVQEELAAAVLATGTPVVTVLVSGRPCGSPALHERSAVVLAAWLPGPSGADAIADALVGRTNPGGKLPISMPRSAGHIPVYYAHPPSGGRSHWKGDYVDAPVAPLYPFGHGLSYTSFALHDAVIDTPRVEIGGQVELRVRVTNHGPRAGDEVVQVYVRDLEACVTRPVLALVAFARVSLEPDETCELQVTIPSAQLGLIDRDLDHIVEPGRVQVHVGSSAASTELVGEVELIGEVTACERILVGPPPQITAIR